VLKAGEKNPASTALMAFLISPAAQEVMRSFGYIEHHTGQPTLPDVPSSQPLLR
jgi:ABC-type Fe3+ transport system substrate-binding protein